MTQIEALFVAYIISNEGYRYGLQSKTSFPAINDPLFHTLREDYINNVKGSSQKLRRLILKTAGLKTFTYEHINFITYGRFTKKEIDAEDKRWSRAQEANTARWMSEMRAELEPNNIMKEFLNKKSKK